MRALILDLDAALEELFDFTLLQRGRLFVLRVTTLTDHGFFLANFTGRPQTPQGPLNYMASNESLLRPFATPIFVGTL